MHHFDHPQASQMMFLLCGLSSIVGYLIARAFAKMPKQTTGEEDILKTENNV